MCQQLCSVEGTSPELRTLCSLLQREKGITRLTLAVNESTWYDGAGNGVVLQGLTSALRKLGEAASSKVLRLAGIAQHGLHGVMPMSPAMMQAVGTHFPHLTHLRARCLRNAARRRGRPPCPTSRCHSRTSTSPRAGMRNLKRSWHSCSGGH